MEGLQMTGAGVPGRLEGVRESLPFLVTLAAAGVLCFLSGGYIFERSGLVVVAYLLTLAGGLWLVQGWRAPSRSLMLALGLFAAFTVWTGLSLLWSLGPDKTWEAFDVTALYLVVVVAVGLSSVGRLQLRVGAWGFVLISTAVAVVALSDKAFPPAFFIEGMSTRLSDPVGYWNGLALVMVMAVPVVLALAGDRRAPLWSRALVVAAGVPVMLAFFFTLSRGGWVSLAVALLLYFALGGTRLSSFVSLVCVAGPLAAVVYHLRGLETLFAESSDQALRVAQGRELLQWVVVAVVVAAALQATAAWLQRSVSWPRRAPLVAGAAIVVVLAGGVLGSSAVFISEHGGVSWVSTRVSEIVNDAGKPPTSAAGRLASANTGRPPLWRESVRQWRAHPVLGSGAGTFPFSHYRFREVSSVVKHAHSQWFNVLGELGLVGLALFVAALLALFVAAALNLWRRRADDLRALLVAMLSAAAAFGVHISWDWEWDMTGIGVAAFALLAAVTAYSGSESRPSGTARAVWRVKPVASLALVLLAVSWLLPVMAVRAGDAAVLAAADGRPERTLVLAERSASLDPLAVDPLFLQAQALQQLGFTSRALALLEQATRLQPDNYETWYKLGLFQATVLGREKAARVSFQKALSLNPLDRRTLSELQVLGG